MKILGIDPGIERIGWGILDVTNGMNSAVAYGCITTDKHLILQDRLIRIFQNITLIIETYAPDHIGLEELYFSTNVKTAIVVGEARGVILLAAGMKSIPTVSFSPPTIKQALTGYGKADKNQVQHMVKSVLRLQKIPKPDDTADALAIALTFAFTHKMGVKH